MAAFQTDGHDARMMEKMAGLNPASYVTLRNTAVSDRHGNPLVVHHGTVHAFDGFNTTVDIGYHFGTREQARKRLRMMPKVALMGGDRRAGRLVSVALGIKNPFLLLDDPGTWDPRKLAYRVGHLLDRRIDEPTMPCIRKTLQDAGYDGLCYRNMVESTKGSKCLEFSWVAFEKTQIVHLGNDVGADLVVIPEGHRRLNHFDPVFEAQRLGGLRWGSGGLQKMADRNALFTAVRELMTERHPGLPMEDRHGRAHSGKWSLTHDGGGSTDIIVDGDDGAVEAKFIGVGDHDAVREMTRAVSSDWKTFPVWPDGPQAPYLTVRWVPGETLDAVVGRATAMIHDVDALMLSARASVRVNP